MKEYKYKINGNLYKVSVGEIEKNIAHVEVNGTVYNVEMEEAAPVKVSAPKPSSAPRTATGEPVALILFSIFIASRISTVCPTFTVSPIFTKISLTTPGSGDFTASAPELTDV